MTGLSLGLVIEGLVALLLLLTIGYCIALNRRLQRLRADEEIMRATISELITATEIAERAILGLKATANDCEKTMSARLAEAEHVTARLGGQVAAGEALFQRIIQITHAGRTAAAAPSQPPAPSPAISLKSAAEEAAARVQKLRRMTGERAA